MKLQRLSLALACLAIIAMTVMAAHLPSHVDALAAGLGVPTAPHGCCHDMPAVDRLPCPHLGIAAVAMSAAPALAGRTGPDRLRWPTAATRLRGLAPAPQEPPPKSAAWT